MLNMINYTHLENCKTPGYAVYFDNYLENKEYEALALEIIFIVWLFVSYKYLKYNNINLIINFLVSNLFYQINVHLLFDLFFIALQDKYMHLMNKILDIYMLLWLVFMIYVLGFWNKFKNLKARMLLIIFVNITFDILLSSLMFVLYKRPHLCTIKVLLTFLFFACIVIISLIKIYIILISKYFRFNLPLRINQYRAYRHVLNKSAALCF